MNVTPFVRRHPVATYFGMAFIISWVAFIIVVGPKLIRGQAMQSTDTMVMFPILIVGVSLAGIALTGAVDGRAGLQGLSSRIGRRRVDAHWYAAAMLIPPDLIIAVLLSLHTLVSPDFAPHIFPLGILFGLAPGFLEEIGWMGYAYPKLHLQRNGILGVVTLVTSFAINPGPPTGATIAQVLEFGKQHHDAILVGAWLQGIGSLLNVLFVLAMVDLAGATHRFAGWVTMLAGTTILMVSLAEVTFYLSAVQAGASGDVTTLAISLSLIKAVQHVFLIAPALLLPLGYVILESAVLPGVYGYLALALGVTLEVLGFVGLFDVLQPLIDIVLIVQEFWMATAAIALAVRPHTTTNPSASRNAEPAGARATV